MIMMKKWIALPVAAVVAVGLVACGEEPTALAPMGPNSELVNPDNRIAAEDVNAHVYGSFALSFTEVVGGSGGEGGWQVITEGPANFPGNAKNAGTCDDGLWINKQGKRTSGSLDKPHPHCVEWVEGDDGEEVTVHVVLEPISALYSPTGSSAGEQLVLGTHDDGQFRAFLTGSGTHSRGEGIVVGYAIDASTLGTTNRRVGTLTFDLAQYHQNNVNYFETDCTIDDVPDAPRCLDLVITAVYEPLEGDAGVGEVTGAVTGFLYWSEASAPFNYDAD
jgi:hypothetical protein